MTVTSFQWGSESIYVTRLKKTSYILKKLSLLVFVARGLARWFPVAVQKGLQIRKGGSGLQQKKEQNQIQRAF